MRLSTGKTPHNHQRGELCSISYPVCTQSPISMHPAQQVMQRAAFLWCSWQAACCALLSAMQGSEEPVAIIPSSSSPAAPKFHSSMFETSWCLHNPAAGVRMGSCRESSSHLLMVTRPLHLLQQSCASSPALSKRGLWAPPQQKHAGTEMMCLDPLQKAKQ